MIVRSPIISDCFIREYISEYISDYAIREYYFAIQFDDN